MKLTFIFDQYGFSISNNIKRYIKFTEYKFIYYVRNYKGHLHLVISKNKMNNNKLKKIINKYTWTNKILIDNCYIVYFHPLNKDLSLIDFMYEIYKVKPVD